MKISFLFLMIIFASCSSTSVDGNGCQYVETWWNNNGRNIVYQCDEKPKDNSCHYLRLSDNGSYQCIYRIDFRERYPR